jgi:hypothetical protein
LVFPSRTVSDRSAPLEIPAAEAVDELRRSLAILDALPDRGESVRIDLLRTALSHSLDEIREGGHAAEVPEDRDLVEQVRWAYDRTVAQVLTRSKSPDEDLELPHLHGPIVNLMSFRRRHKELDRACAIAGRFLALAEGLVERYPDHAFSHMTLCQAYVQMAKNAWAIEDRAEVERDWERAVAEAQRASRIDPAYPFARHEVEDLQRRLDDLRHPR